MICSLRCQLRFSTRNSLCLPSARSCSAKSCQIFIMSSSVYASFSNSPEVEMILSSFFAGLSKSLILGIAIAGAALTFGATGSAVACTGAVVFVLGVEGSEVATAGLVVAVLLAAGLADLASLFFLILRQAQVPVAGKKFSSAPAQRAGVRSYCLYKKYHTDVRCSVKKVTIRVIQK